MSKIIHFPRTAGAPLTVPAAPSPTPLPAGPGLAWKLYRALGDTLYVIVALLFTPLTFIGGIVVVFQFGRMCLFPTAHNIGFFALHFTIFWSLVAFWALWKPK